MEEEKTGKGGEFTHHTYTGWCFPKMELKNWFGTWRNWIFVDRWLKTKCSSPLLQRLRQTQQDACRRRSQGCNPELLAGNTHWKTNRNQSLERLPSSVQGRVLSSSCTERTRLWLRSGKDHKPWCKKPAWKQNGKEGSREIEQFGSLKTTARLEAPSYCGLARLMHKTEPGHLEKESSLTEFTASTGNLIGWGRKGLEHGELWRRVHSQAALTSNQNIRKKPALQFQLWR